MSADAFSGRVLLISLRAPSDPMAAHERRCFAERAEVPLDRLITHAMMDGPVPRAALDAAHAVLFGGSGAWSVLDDAPWIRAALDLMVEVVALQRPAYASCFGFQGLALALGGRVENDESRTELGATELTLTEAGARDPLFQVLPSPFWGEQGHHDHVTRLPEGVELLATGRVIAAQAFRVLGAPFWASQFHPELTPTRTMERFLHYKELYVGDGDMAEVEATLRARQQQTPEVASLLSRLVRGLG